MQFNEYQELASRTEKMPDLTGQALIEYRLNHHTLGVTSESGELAGATKKTIIYGKPIDYQNIMEEVGDIMWYLAGLANSLGFTLQQAAFYNIMKLKERYPEKYTDEAAAARLDKQATGETVNAE